MSWFSPEEVEDLPRPSRRRRATGFVALALVAAGILVMDILPRPYVIAAPGPVFNVLGLQDKTPIISISDAKQYPTDGALELLTVNIYGSPKQTPTWPELIGAWLDPSQKILPLEEVFPSGVTQQQRSTEDALLFKDSQSVAKYLALRQLGYQVPVRVTVDSVPADSPSHGLIKAGDIITAVNGQSVDSIQTLRAMVQNSDAGQLVISFERDGVPATVRVTPRLVDGVRRISVYSYDDFKFPVDIKLQLDQVGGPSGGLIFALGVYDKLTPGALTNGELVAGTGTVARDGSVGPIGGIRQKMTAAVRSGASWFLAPAGNCTEVAGHIPKGLTVIKISNFSQAVKAVQQIGKTHQAGGLPSCQP